MTRPDADPVALGFTYQSLTLRTGRARYIDEGGGAPIVLLHGAPFTSLGFFRVIGALKRRYRVLAPDLPGFGHSEALPGFRGRLEDYARFVEDFCRALSLDRIIFYVTDASGAFGLVAAARLAPRVVGLVVADTVQIPLTGKAFVVKYILRHVVASGFVRYLNQRLNLFAWLVASVAPWPRLLAPDERRALLSQFATKAQRDRIIDLFSHMGHDDAFMREAAALAREHLSDKPTLILYGQFDPMRLLGGVRRFQLLFPNHTVCTIPREEHFPILSSGERVGREVHAWIAASAQAEPT